MVQLVVIGLLFGALSEDLGSRSVAPERLQRRWNPLLASLVLALSLMLICIYNRTCRSLLAAIVAVILQTVIASSRKLR